MSALKILFRRGFVIGGIFGWGETTADLVYSGANLTIEAVGTLLQDVGEGAYVDLQVKYGIIKLLTTQADLCEQVSNVDLKCPIKKGQVTITKDVEIPKQIPGVSDGWILSRLRTLLTFSREPTLSLPMRIPRIRRSISCAWRQLFLSKWGS